MKYLSTIFAVLFLIGLFVYQANFAPPKGVDITTTEDVLLNEQEQLQKFLELFSQCTLLDEEGCNLRTDCESIYDEENAEMFKGCIASGLDPNNLPELQ